MRISKKVYENNGQLKLCSINPKIYKIFKITKPNIVIHLAAQSTVDEKIPLSEYYSNNVTGTLNLIEVMKNNNIRHMPVLDANNRLTDFFSIRDFLRAEMQDNLEIKQNHKNVVRYQIMVSVLLIGTTVAGVFFDFFERKNLVVIFSALFLIIGISAVMTIRSNKRYNRED